LSFHGVTPRAPPPSLLAPSAQERHARTAAPAGSGAQFMPIARGPRSQRPSWEVSTSAGAGPASSSERSWRGQSSGRRTSVTVAADALPLRNAWHAPRSGLSVTAAMGSGLSRPATMTMAAKFAVLFIVSVAWAPDWPRSASPVQVPSRQRYAANTWRRHSHEPRSGVEACAVFADDRFLLSSSSPATVTSFRNRCCGLVEDAPNSAWPGTASWSLTGGVGRKHPTTKLRIGRHPVSTLLAEPTHPMPRPTGCPGPTAVESVA
jgi:hypothetical protein